MTDELQINDFVARWLDLCLQGAAAFTTAAEEGLRPILEEIERQRADEEVER